MLRRRPPSATPSGNLSLVRVAPTGLGTGVLTGFFRHRRRLRDRARARAAARPADNARGRNLIAGDHAHQRRPPGRPPASGSIDWTIASTFTGAAIAGALAGRRLNATVRPERLGQLFALLLVAIAVFLVTKNAAAAV
jgi:hypothetical protein